MIDMGSNNVDDSVLVSDNVSQISLACEIVELYISLIPEIGSGLNFLEFPIPEQRVPEDL